MKYVAKKFLTLIITLFIVSLLAFLAFQVIPGDPTTKMLGTEATPEAVAALRAELGLDKPVPVRYWNWLTAFLTGDMGTSYSYHMPVGEMLSEKLTITAILTILSFAFTVILSIPLGILAGSVRSKSLDWLITAFDQVVMSIPSFFIGILACFLFGIVFRLFTPGNFVSYTQDWGACIAYLLFPALSIAIPRIAMTVKMLRSALLAEMNKDYVRTSYSRGNDRRATLYLHVLRNALPPVVSFLAMTVADIVAGSVVIEQVFAIPGLGRLLLTSISNRDYPVVQAVVVLVAFWVVLVNLLGDLLNQRLDPRLRLTD